MQKRQGMNNSSFLHPCLVTSHGVCASVLFSVSDVFLVMGATALCRHSFEQASKRSEASVYKGMRERVIVQK